MSEAQIRVKHIKSGKMLKISVIFSRKFTGNRSSLIKVVGRKKEGEVGGGRRGGG